MKIRANTVNSFVRSFVRSLYVVCAVLRGLKPCIVPDLAINSLWVAVDLLPLILIAAYIMILIKERQPKGMPDGSASKLNKINNWLLKHDTLFVILIYISNEKKDWSNLCAYTNQWWELDGFWNLKFSIPRWIFSFYRCKKKKHRSVAIRITIGKSHIWITEYQLMSWEVGKKAEKRAIEIRLFNDKQKLYK